MSTYFNNFPKINYKINLDGQNRNIYDITKKFQPLKSVLNNITLYYDYSVRDGETPEIVADKFYGDMSLHWIILMFNNIIDPYFDWVMDYDTFSKYIEDKYGSIQNATQTVKEYYRIIQQKGIAVDNSLIPEYKIKIDYDTYVTLDANERELVYVYDWEYNLNESKRVIKIIDSIYIPSILKEKEKIFS